MGFIGVGGLITTVGSLYALPPAIHTDIISIQNERRNSRTRTKVIGGIAVVLLVISAVLYFNLTSLLRPFGKVCELSEVPHDVSIAIAPFLLAAAFALLFSLWFRARVVGLKKN
jgi:hypothetical protein